MTAPVFCPKCGLLFQSNAINMSGSGTIVFENCGESCPQCGSVANIIDGEYQFYNGIINTVKGGKFAKDAVEKLKKLTGQALISNDPKNSEAFKEIIDIIKANNEPIGNSIEMFLKSSNGAKATVILLMVIWYAISQVNNFVTPITERAGEEAANYIFGEDTTNNKKQ